jgi:hypothetical protein
MNDEQWKEKEKICAGCESLYREQKLSDRTGTTTVINCNMTPTFEGKE